MAAEAIVALARFNAALLAAMHAAVVHEQERSGAAWTLEWLILPQMATATGAALRISAGLADQIDGHGKLSSPSVPPSAVRTTGADEPPGRNSGRAAQFPPRFRHDIGV